MSWNCYRSNSESSGFVYSDDKLNSLMDFDFQILITKDNRRNDINNTLLRLMNNLKIYDNTINYETIRLIMKKLDDLVQNYFFQLKSSVIIYSYDTCNENRRLMYTSLDNIVNFMINTEVKNKDIFNFIKSNDNLDDIDTLKVIVKNEMKTSQSKILSKHPLPIRTKFSNQKYIQMKNKNMMSFLVQQFNPTIMSIKINHDEENLIEIIYDSKSGELRFGNTLKVDSLINSMSTEYK
ncbi:unnamed protein product, partial [Didymodactylos carnosus]